MALDKELEILQTNNLLEKRLWLFKESWAKHSVELQNIYWDFEIFTKSSKLKVKCMFIYLKNQPCYWEALLLLLHCSLKLKIILESQGFP